MSLKTEISLKAAQAYGTKYDEAVKETFHNPEIIAPILKYVVSEYKDCSIDDIICYIDKSSIKDAPIDSASVMADMLPTEDNSIGEKLVRYDTHFKAVNPKSLANINVFLHFDLEVQNTYKPGYDIVKRGIFYTAREISSQLGILTNQTDYGTLEKVYSIWICNEDVPKKIQNTITKYSFTKNDIVGSVEEPESIYDLMNVIVIRRGGDSDVDVLDYLNGIFSCDIDKISEHVTIRDNESIMEGVKKMSGLWQPIFEQGIEQGIEQGSIETLISLVRDGDITVEIAAKKIGITEEQFTSLMEKQE